MAIAALLPLKDRRTLPFERRAANQVLHWDGIATPRTHDWAPGCVAGQMCQGAESHGRQRNGDHGDRAPLPALLALTSEKWQQEEKTENNYGANQQCRSLYLWRQ